MPRLGGSGTRYLLNVALLNALLNGQRARKSNYINLTGLAHPLAGELPATAAGPRWHLLLLFQVGSNWTETAFVSWTFLGFPFLHPLC